MNHPVERSIGERFWALQAAFDYLLDQARAALCTCAPPDARIVVHEDPCPLAVAIDVAAGLREVPP